MHNTKYFPVDRKSESVAEGARLMARREAVEFTPEQSDVLMRLEAYPRETFNMRHWFSNERGQCASWRTDECFTCVAGWLSDDGRTHAQDEVNYLRALAGSAAEEMGVLLFNGVPGHPLTAVPKSVAINAVREIFRMGNADGGSRI